MLSAQEIQQLLEQARRNEKIQQRLDEVEEFILARHAFRDLLRHLPRRVATIYELDNVTLTLVADNQRLREAVEGPLQGELPAGCFLRRRQELRLLLADLERPFLSNRLAEEFIACFFSPGPFVASAAIIPLWVRGEMRGTLDLGSASPRRYQPDFETRFLRGLGRKVAAGMDSALLMEQARLLERECRPTRRCRHRGENPALRTQTQNSIRSRGSAAVADPSMSRPMKSRGYA